MRPFDRRFQFLYGAIGSPRWLQLPAIQSSFNSYMVRLEVREYFDLKPKIKVSIPIWCDWKVLRSIPAKRQNFVSIPIWCDWKNQEKRG